MGTVLDFVTQSPHTPVKIMEITILWRASMGSVKRLILVLTGLFFLKRKGSMRDGALLHYFGG